MNSTAVSSEGCTTGEAADRKGCRGRTRDGTGQLSGARSYLGASVGPRPPQAVWPSGTDTEEQGRAAAELNSGQTHRAR